MKIIKPSHKIIFKPSREEALRVLEFAGRTAYQTKHKIEPGSAGPFISRLMNMKHLPVMRHVNITVMITQSRDSIYQMIRHQLAEFSGAGPKFAPSYVQSSTRYVDPTVEIHGGAAEFVMPAGLIGTDKEQLMIDAMEKAEKTYRYLRKMGTKKEEARSIISGLLKAELVITTNLQHWLWIIAERTATAAQLDIRNSIIAIEKDLKDWLPEVFDHTIPKEEMLITFLKNNNFEFTKDAQSKIIIG